MALTPQPEKYAEIVGGDKIEKDDAIGERALLNQIDRMIEYLKEEGDMSDGDARKILVGGIVAESAKAGGEANEVYNSYPNSAKNKLLYTPEDLERNQEITVKGTKLSIASFLGATVLSVAGVVIASVFKSKLPKWLRVIPAIALPFILSALLSRLGWTISSAVNNWNDVFHWGPQFAQQQSSTFDKKTSIGGSSGLTGGSESRTIIRMVTESKPTQFLGTLYSAKLANVEAFERKLDDEITDTKDLLNDVSLNLNRWLKSLPGRMGYSITIRKDPVDEFGVKQSGIWACLTLVITHISNKTSPIDTILLGPVNPAMRLEIVKQTKTIEAQIPDLITTGELKEIQLPNGIVDIFSTEGEKVFSTQNTTQNITPTTTPKTETNTKNIDVKQISVTDSVSFDKYQKEGYEFRSIQGNPNMIEAYKEKETTTPKTTPKTTPNSNTLRNGSSGDSVKALQSFLNTQGESLVVDGKFGSKTEEAVKRFQNKHALLADGIVGPKTWNEIDVILRATKVQALDTPMSAEGALIQLLGIEGRYSA